MKNKISILILVLALAIGFTVVSTTFVLNGVIGISNKKDDFKVIFTNAKLDGTRRKEFIDSTTKQTINYETNKLTTIDETTTLEYEVTNTSRLYDAEVSITCNIVDDGGNPTTSEYVTMENIPDDSIIVTAGESKSGSITIKLIKASAEDMNIKIKCSLNADARERDTLGEEYREPYELTNDVNGNGLVDIGDEIRVGTESFNVISITDAEINALAKYNLKVGGIYTSNGTFESIILSSEEGYGIQNAQMRAYVSNEKRYGTVVFSDNSGWPNINNATINIKDYDGPVNAALYGENGYEKYMQKYIPNSSVRLITKQEIETLINNGNNLSNGFIQAKIDAKGYGWLYYTSYWTQTSYTDANGGVWYMNSGAGFFGGSRNGQSGNGVRPVITIPLS